MNKIYRLVWNKSLSLWTVVSENARGVTKKRNVTTIQTVTEFTSSSLQQNNKLLKLKPSLIALTISTVFLSTGAFAGANMGGGTSNQGSSTAISPTNDQCGSAGQATVNGMPNSVAIGCGSRVNQTNNQVQGIAQRRGGGSSEPYPDGTANHVPSAVAIGNKNVTGAGGGVAIGNANESNATFANVAIGQGNRAIGGGFGTALGIGNLTDGSSNVAIGVANRARGNTAIALGRQTYAEADFAIAQGNTATVAAGATGGIAMGNAATTKGVRGIAIGSGTGGANYDATTAANADGADSVAIGTGAKGTGDGSTAVGRQAIASGESSTAMGDKAKAEGNGDVAIGTNAYAKGPNNLSATAVGRNSHAEGEDALAVGNSAKATANYAGAFGNFAQASAQNAMAVGNSAKASGDFSSAFGNFSEAAGLQSVASGNRAKATADYSSAYGNLAEASGIQSTALGNGAKSIGLRSTAVGHVATASGADSVATGPNAQAIGDSTIATGNNAQAQGENDIAIGRDAATSSGTTDNIAIGHGVTTGDTGQNVAMGSGSTSANAASSEGGAVAIGRDQVARGDGAVAIGDPNNANGNGAVALGRNNTAAGNDDATEAANGAIAIGNENKAIGQGSVALGNQSTAAEAGSIALGDSANAQAARGIALGSNAVATNADDVALGAGSVTSTATGDSFLTGIAAPASVVSVGSAGNERRIQHLSDGAEDTDAVNVRQLKHVKDVVDEQGESTANALGGGSTYDPETGAVSNPTYNINGNDMNNVGDALAELDKGWTLQSNGENADAIKAGDTVDIGTADGEENLQVEKEGNNIKYSLNRDLKVDSVTAGDTVMNTDGMTIAGGPSVTKSGIDAGGNKITNVAEGTEGTDAVNKDQLDRETAAAKTEVEAGKNMTVESETGADGQTIYTVATADDVEFDSVKVGDVSIDGATGKITGVTAGDVNPDSTDAINGSQLAGTAQSVSDALGGGSTVNPDGTVTAPNYNINGTDVNNVGDALAELDKGWTLQSNGENADAIKAGDTVDIGTADGEENLQVSKEGNDIKYSLNRDLKVDSVTAGDTVMNNDGMTIAGGPSVTKSGIDAAGNKITNVADGTEASDAVNKGQLDQVGDDLTDKGFGLTAQDGSTVQKKLGEAVEVVGADSNISTKVQDGKVAIELARDLDVDSVTAGDTVINNEGLTITGGPSVTKDGIDAAGNKITNVAAGDVNPDSTDAINGSQLAGTAQSVSDALGGGSTVNPDGTVSAPTYNVNGNNVNNVGDALAELDKGWTLQSNGENADAIKAGDTVDIGTADGEENLQVSKEGNDIKYSLNRDLKVDSVTAGDTVMNTDGMTIAGGPSVTKDGIDAAGNKITNVADGTDASDAVNKGQLDQVGNDLTDKGFGLTAQDGSTVQKKLGEAVEVVGADSNISTKVQDGKVAIELARDLDVDSVTAGDTVMNTDGMTIAGGPSVTKDGIDAAGNKITNVAAGDVNPDSTDAINGSQLAGTAQSVSDALGGGSTVNPDGTVSAPTYNVNGNNVNNVGDALAELDKGWTLQTNGENADAIKAGDTVDIGTADGEENLQVAKEGNDIKYSLNRDLKVDSVTAGDTVINNDGMTIAGGPSVTKDGIDAGGSRITNVGDGTEASDAVNKGQLDQVNDDLTNKGFGLTAQDGSTVQKKLGEAVEVVGADSNISTKVQDGKVAIELARDLDVDSVTAGDTVINNEGLTIAGGPSVTKDGIDAAGNKITNVADGDVAAGSKDAVNGGQLNDSVGSVGDMLGGGVTNEGGKLNGPFTVNDNGYANVADAIEGETAAAKTEVEAGKNMTVESETGANGQTIYTVATADDVEFNTVKVGDVSIDGATGKITGVTAGDVNPDSTDAINGSQLAGTAQSVSDALGGGSIVNPDGTVSTPTYNVNGNNVNNVGDALAELDKGWTLQSNGENADAIKAGDTVDIGTADGEENLQVAKEGNDIKYSLNRDLKVDSVTAGDTVINNEGLTIAGGPSVTKSGMDAGGNKITNVAEGTEGTDAVNKDQLDQVVADNDARNSKLGESTANALGGGSTYDPETGAISNPNYSVNGNDVNNVGDAIAELDKGWTLQTNGENAAAVKAGDTVDIGTADGEENLQVAKDGNDIKYSLNRDLKVDSVTAGDTVINNEGLTIAGGPSITKDGIDAAGNKITNVAAGTEGTDAVNKDQLDQVVAGNDNRTSKLGESTASGLGGGSTYDPVTGAISSPTYTVNGSDVNNVGDAITALDKGWTLQTNGENAGAVKAGDPVDIGTADGEENLKVAKDGNDIKYSLNRDLKVDSVTAGDTRLDNSGVEVKDAVGNSTTMVAGGTIVKDAQGNSTATTAAGTTIKDVQGNSTILNGTGLVFTDASGAPVGPSVSRTGIDAGGEKITNVAEGEVAADSKEAINGSQLHAQGEGVKDIIGGDTAYDPETGRYTNPNIGGTGKDNLNDAISAVGDAATKAKTTVTEGDNMVVTESTNADGSTNYEVATARDVNFDSVQVGEVN
ncbi:hypothetical protein F971_00364, partial [Acinetobacter vivianii]